MQRTTSNHRLYRLHEFIEVLTTAGLRPATGDECDTARIIAADLISPHVALAPTFRRVQASSGGAVSVYIEAGEITGVMGMVPLRPEGLRAVQEHLFDPKNPPVEFLCQEGSPFSAVYGWGLASLTRKASASVVLGAMKLRERFRDIPFFTRAATPAGAKVIFGRLGYAPYPGAPDDLLWNPVHPSQERAA